MIDSLKNAFPSLAFRDREALERHTTFRIGGPATVFVEVSDEAQLIDLITWLRGTRSRFLLLGGGSNLLMDTAGFEGVVVSNRALYLTREGSRIEASGGTDLQAVVRFALENGLERLEFASGIPGSFGGGVAGNAGAYGSNLGEILDRARVLLTNGQVREVGPDFFEFSYRRCCLQRTGEILLSATLTLSPARNSTASRRRCEEILAERARKHPDPGVPSAGSYFKNLDRFDEDGRRVPAGRLLDQVGCKGLAVGGAQVFEKHANIIVNRGNATSDDVLKLAAEMAHRVRESFGITLEPEVRYVCARDADRPAGEWR